MALVGALIEEKARKAISAVSRKEKVVRVCLFGSQAEGAAHGWSDIDLAMFVEGVENWSVRDRAKMSARIQREAGDDVEPHFFPAHSLENPEPASFAAWVLRKGIEIGFRD